jgi:hypothetical protein
MITTVNFRLQSTNKVCFGSCKQIMLCSTLHLTLIVVEESTIASGNWKKVTKCSFLNEINSEN